MDFCVIQKGNKMIDQYGRTINYMRISVTDRCNLRCTYCMPEDGITSVGHQDILTFDEITKIVQCGVKNGITKIKLTGGEPLVRKNLAELVRKIHQIKGTEEITLTTNGVLLKEQMEELVQAGIQAINISLDTLCPAHYKTITRRDELAQVLEGIEAALLYKQVKVKINCVLLKDTTEEEFCELAALAKNRPVSVRFIEPMPIGFGKTTAGFTQEDILEILRGEFGKEEMLKNRLGNGPAVYVRFSKFCGEIGFISAMSHKFCNQCNRVRLTAEGFLKPCLQYAGGVDLKELLRKGASLEEITEVMKREIYQKPISHQFEQTDRQGFEQKTMSEIGG